MKRTLDVWVPGATLGWNAFKKLTTRQRMARTKTDRTKAYMCAIKAVREKYPRAADQTWTGFTAIDFEVRAIRLRDTLFIQGSSIKAIQDGICQAVLPLGDGPKTFYQWNPPTQVKVGTKAEEGVMVRIATIEEMHYPECPWPAATCACAMLART